MLRFSSVPLGLLVLVAMAVAPACQCGNTLRPPDPGVCDKTTVCEKGLDYRKGVCATARCDNKKNGNTDCCPGQFCRFDGKCVDQTQACMVDADCAGGQVCSTRPEIDSEKNICSFPIPAPTGECPLGYQIFNHRCIRDLPCGAGCPETQVCNIETNTCEDLPQIPTRNHGCEVSCGVGTIKTYADPDGMIFNQCCSVICRCETLPPLTAGSFGKHADGAVAEEAIVVSSYNETYGDLILSRHDKATGNQLSVEFVDGVPASGVLAGDPNGVRKGIKDPGQNVGLYSSVAVPADGKIRIAYYDADAKDLKYAEETSSGWNIHTVDAAGDVGKYATMFISDGKIRLAYFVEKAPPLSTQSFAEGTGLRYAEAGLSPRSANDWQRRDVDMYAVRPLPCEGQTCQGAEICVVAATEQCAIKATGCAGMPLAGQVCATLKSGTTGFFTENPLPKVEELPLGMGLFPSIAQKGSTLIIAYYDNYTPPGVYVLEFGQLRGATADVSGAGAASLFSAPVVLDNGTTCDGKSRDVGRFASLAVAPDGHRIGVAYLDATRGALRFYGDENLVADNGCMPAGEDVRLHTNQRIRVVDNGIDQANSRISLVGADASLVFDPTSVAHVAYQDSTALDARISSEQGLTVWDSRDVFADDKAHGFYLDLLSESGAYWLVDVRLGFAAGGIPSNELSVKKLPGLPLP